MTDPPLRLAVWTWLIPLACSAVLASALLVASGSTAAALLAGVALAAGVAAAVHHAEVVAQRVGEPYGSIVLALAVTVIEAGLIAMLMLSGGPASAALARDTVFAAVMLVSNGVLGLCLLVGGLRHGEQGFQIQGASSLLAVLATLVTLTLVLPTFTTTTAGATYSGAQLAFAGFASLGLYVVFIFVQTIRHRGDFLSVDGDGDEVQAHALAPNARQAWLSLGLLVLSLVAVVGLAKVLAPFIERAVAAAGAPGAVVGMAIALLVLMPETIAAVRAASANRLQTSLNLALGSAVATIGLTIPAVAVLSLWLDWPLVLGLDPKSLVLLALTFGVGTLTLGTGRTTVLQGAVHLVILAAFVVLTFIP